MRTHLAAERATMVICDLTGLDEFAVVGRLHAIWVWAGEHTVTGDVTGVTLKTIDRVTRCENFGDAMKAAGWLETLPDGGVRFPRWKRHNSKAAKARALANERQARKRKKDRDTKRDGERDTSVTSHASRVEQRQSRAEKRQNTASTTAQCKDRGVQGGKIQAAPDNAFVADPMPSEFLPTLDTIQGILQATESDQIGFMAKLAYADASGFEFPKPIWDYVGRAKGKANKAGYLTEAIRSDLGPERWQDFLAKVPSPAHCQWLLVKAGRERADG